MVSNFLHYLDTHKGTEGAGERSSLIINQQFWLTREVLDKRKLANGLPIYRKGQKEDLGHYRTLV